MPWDDLDTDRVIQIMSQIDGKDIDEYDTIIPQYRIKGQGIAYYWAPTLKSFVRINKGTNVYVISHEMDEKRRILVFDKVRFFAIPFKELEKVGYN